MRNQILLIILMFACLTLYGQNRKEYFKTVPNLKEEMPIWAQKMYAENPSVKEVIYEYEKYFKKHKFIKTVHTQNFKYWVRQVQNSLDSRGFIQQLTYKEQQARTKQIKSKRKQNQKSTANWTCIGPFETYKNGSTQKISQQANVYSIDQSLTNANILIAGSEAGGVYYSSDKAQNWSLISKGEIFVSGITAVKIHPTNNNIFLIAGNSRIYRTTNAGTTWNEVHFLDGSGNEFKYDPANSNHVFCVSSSGLFESNDGGVSWTIVFSETCWDLDYHPTNNNIVYLLKSDGVNKTEFYKSTNGGNNFSLITNGWYMPQNPNEASESGGKIGVSIDQPDRVYAALIGNSKSGDDGWIGLYRSNNSGDSWFLPSGQIGSPYQNPNTMPWNAAAYSSGYHQGFYNFDMEVSPNDADLIWFGTIRLNESSDGGYTYNAIGAANSQRLSDIHADIQDIEVLGNDIWVASDGGLNYSNDELQSHEARNTNLSASDFWGFANGWNEDIYVGGKYHNGNTAYLSNYGLGQTHNVGGVEEATGYLNPLFNKHAYFNEYWAGGVRKRSIPDMLGGAADVLATYSIIPNESYVESSSSGYYFHPNCANTIYAGRDSVIYKSIDGGAQFTPLFDFNATGKVYGIEISRSNPDVMYCVWQPGGGYWDWCEIYKTVDGGLNWTKLTNPPTNNRWRLEIAISDSNPNVLWVSCNDGANGQKVYETTDGGVNWINLSSIALDGEDLKDIYGHTINGGHIIYVVSQTGVFVRKSTTGIWENYSNGLPLITRGFRLLPFFKDNKIRLGTYGRGVWESDLDTPPEIQVMPMTLSKSISCSRDTSYFDSYSIIQQNNVSYNWSFDPAPMFIDDQTKRNPKVVFGTNGIFDVTLSITDANNVTHSKTITDMVSIDSGCEMETVPGLMLETTQSGDYVQLPDLNIQTNSFTVTAWVKPDGIQPNYSSILMNDGDAAGLNFREGNNTLGYHWPGGAWWWDSNLEVPAGVWSHVALVATPNSITVYLNGEPSVHNTTVNVVDIGAMKIGSYKGWGDRNYYGNIDEVAIWNRSLSTEEIRLHRHLTKQDLVDPDFKAYYQFNENQSLVLDRKYTNHGTLNNGANRVNSNAPIGGGVSELQNISSSGLYTFGDPGIEIDFQANNPAGEIVVSRINLMPNAPPEVGNEINKYWIVNNYGNQNFAGLNSISFDDNDSNAGSTSRVGNIVLYQRSENEFLTNWSALCNLSSATAGGNYLFGSNCGLSNFGQLVVFDDCLHTRFETKDYLDNQIERLSSSNNIDAENLIGNGADIEYDASQEINLDIDFEVNAGADFRAYIRGCNN